MEYAMTISYLLLAFYSYYFCNNAVKNFHLQKSVICIAPDVLVSVFRCYLLREAFSPLSNAKGCQVYSSN